MLSGDLPKSHNVQEPPSIRRSRLLFSGVLGLFGIGYYTTLGFDFFKKTKQSQGGSVLLQGAEKKVREALASGMKPNLFDISSRYETTDRLLIHSGVTPFMPLEFQKTRDAVFLEDSLEWAAISLLPMQIFTLRHMWKHKKIPRIPPGPILSSIAFTVATGWSLGRFRDLAGDHNKNAPVYHVPLLGEVQFTIYDALWMGAVLMSVSLPGYGLGAAVYSMFNDAAFHFSQSFGVLTHLQKYMDDLKLNPNQIPKKVKRRRRPVESSDQVQPALETTDALKTTTSTTATATTSETLIQEANDVRSRLLETQRTLREQPERREQIVAQLGDLEAEVKRLTERLQAFESGSDDDKKKK